MSFASDGAPVGTPFGRSPLPGAGWEAGDSFAPQHPTPTPTDPAWRPASPLRAAFGPRGSSARAAVALRWVASYLLAVALALVAHLCFVGTSAASGGAFLFVSMMIIAVAGAAGCAFYAGDRVDVTRQARHYMFGLVGVPGAALAVIAKASSGLTSQATQFDSFTSLLSSGLPIVYFATVCIPPVVFVKYIAGLRTFNRSSLDNEEMVARYTRQDGLMK